MTASRRLAEIEGSLSGTDLVLAWLSEAQAFDTVEDYVRAELAQSPPTLPLDRLISAATDNGRGNHSVGRGRSVNDRERRVLAVVFPFYLVIGSWTLACAEIDRQQLVGAVIAGQLGIYGLEDDEAERSTQRQRRLATLRSAALARRNRLAALALARERIATRTFGGHALLLPGIARDWAECLHGASSLAAAVVRLGELDGLDPVDEEELEPDEAWIDEAVAAHLGAARVKTYDLVGDGPRLRRAVLDWLGSSEAGA